MQTHLHHIGLAVTDVEATIEALVAAFDAQRLLTPTAGHLLIRLGDFHLALVRCEDAEPTERAWGDHLAMTLDKVERNAAIRTLMEHQWLIEDVRGHIYAQTPDGMLTLELLLA